MGRDHNYKKKVERKPERKPKAYRQGTNYTEKEARFLTKNYTNKRIREQIENDNSFFFLGILLTVIGIILIITAGELGLVFGVTILVIVCIFAVISGMPNMRKHIMPAYSSRKYTPQEIDAMANDPATVWNETIRAFVTPTTLIGINKGLTVVDYDDVDKIRSWEIMHSERATTINSDARKFGKRVHGFRHYKDRLEWYSYILIVKTHSGKRLMLTETAYKDGRDALQKIVEEHRSAADMS